MEIRRTKPEELDQVMAVYEAARRFMRKNGNPNQWINGYPGPERIRQDILASNSYLCLGNGRVIGVFTFIRDTEPTYHRIDQGKWLNDAPYGVVHRIASTNERKGVAAFCLGWCLNQCGNLRIDTHRDNRIMQNVLKKNGFTECGVIYLEDGSERLAYQKVLRSYPAAASVSEGLPAE